MAFTFNNYATSEMSKSPIADIISNLFGGYEQGVKASYLQPSLAEQLQKSQLQNKWYGPNMQSQIGLRGAQAGHLGAMTQGLNITNPFLKDKLMQEQEQRAFQIQQNEMLTNMLRQRLSRHQGQNNQGQSIPSGANTESIYQPGAGQPPYREPIPNDQTGVFNPPNPQAQPNQTGLFQGEPEITNDDLTNKKFFGQDTFTPKHKAWVDMQTSGMKRKQAEEFKLQAKQDFQDFKESSAAQKDLPVLKNALKSAIQMKKIIKNRPAFWGHYWFPDRFAKRATDPLAGEFQGKLVPFIADVESQLSNRGNQLALKTAAQKVPYFDDTQPVALGKVDALINSLMQRMKVSQDLAGGNIVRRGTKRFKFVDGKWFEITKDNK